MSEKIRMLNLETSKEFNTSREECTRGFFSGISLFKRKLTQGLYWTSLDKDLANQFFRDERWFCGIKFWDAMKTIDHGGETREIGIGFKPKTQ